MPSSRRPPIRVRRSWPKKNCYGHGGLIRPLTGDGAERGEAERRRYRPGAGGNTSRSTAAGRWKLFFPVEKGSETLVGICAGRSAAAWVKGFDAPEKAGSEPRRAAKSTSEFSAFIYAEARQGRSVAAAPAIGRQALGHTKPVATGSPEFGGVEMQETQSFRAF